MDFSALLAHAKVGDLSAVEEIIALYRPLLFKQSIVGGVLDEDLYQELCLTVIRCIQRFDI